MFALTFADLRYCRERLLDITQYKIDECSMSGYERKKTAEAFLKFYHLHF